MPETYAIYGAEMSPYSMKVRSYLRYKGIPHRWIVRNTASEAEFQRLARLPLVPLVVAPDGTVLQDSTPVMEALETRHPEPSVHPAEPAAAFVSVLLEEFGDEWGNKWMFHFRWAREVDQVASAGRLARAMLPDADDEQHAAMAAMLRTRMVDRLWFVGSNAHNAPFIEAGFAEAIALLEAHLAGRPYLFGGRPAFGDFGLWAQLYETWTDPTPGALIEGRTPHVLEWIQRMLWPRAEGPFEPWAALEPTLMPLLQRQVSRLFLPWTRANAAALAEGREEFSVELAGHQWTQKPQKYHAKSLRTLRDKYAAAADRPAIDAVLERAGCLAPLRG